MCKSIICAEGLLAKLVPFRFSDKLALVLSKAKSSQNMKVLVLCISTIPSVKLKSFSPKATVDPLCLFYKEAARRPKDFGGLEAGWSENYGIRHTTYGMQLQRTGPALCSAGLWTSLAISLLPNPDIPASCARCDALVETTTHRLWLCSQPTFSHLHSTRWSQPSQYLHKCPA